MCVLSLCLPVKTSFDQKLADDQRRSLYAAFSEVSLPPANVIFILSGCASGRRARLLHHELPVSI